MYKFAHIADCHLGAQKYSKLKELELKAFKEALDICMAEEVDFIIIAGDLFHSNLPDMSVVKETVKKLREVKEKGIPVYIIYGSHDFSPNRTSMVDIVSEMGLMKNLFNTQVIKDEEEREQIQLKFTVDPRTGAKLTGIPGRKMGIDKSYYEKLDRKSLESEDGFKIFVYHTSVKNILPKDLIQMGGVNIGCFPRNFDYYAGGHIHKRVCENKLEEYNIITYPGPLFGSSPKDLETNAKGEKRGFYIIEYENHNINLKFHPLELVEYLYLEFNAEGKTSTQVNEEIKEELERRKNQGEIEGKIVVLKVKGELSSGKDTDVNFKKVNKYLRDADALHVSINHSGLVSRKYTEIRVKSGNEKEIEENLFLENLENIDLLLEELKGVDGKELAIKLFEILKQKKKTREKKKEYNQRILNESLLELNLDLSE